jgi:hypothetical protein
MQLVSSYSGVVKRTKDARFTRKVRDVEFLNCCCEMREKEIIGVSSCVGRNWIDAKVCIKCFCDLLTKSVLLSALDDAMNYAERAPNEYKRCWN